MILFSHKFHTRHEAETIISKMREAADFYGSVNVADLKGLVGCTCDHSDVHKSWTPEEWSKAQVVSCEGRYRIEYPSPIYDAPTSRSTSKVSYIDYGKKQESRSTKPLYITVERDSIEDFGDTMSELFVQIRSVTDREVHIVIK